MGFDDPLLEGRSLYHLCIDMQGLFSPEGPWPTPWMESVLPNIAATAELFGSRSVFTRFIPAVHPDVEIGTWRDYYRRWSNVTLDKLDAPQLDVVEELRRFVPPAQVVDKNRFSAFAAPDLAPILNAAAVDTLVITGAETDMCVMATVMDALDRGYWIIIVSDAVCSSSDTGHDASLAIYRHRFAEQISVINISELADRMCSHTR